MRWEQKGAKNGEPSTNKKKHQFSTIEQFSSKKLTFFFTLLVIHSHLKILSLDLLNNTNSLITNSNFFFFTFLAKFAQEKTKTGGKKQNHRSCLQQSR